MECIMVRWCQRKCLIHQKPTYQDANIYFFLSTNICGDSASKNKKQVRKSILQSKKASLEIRKLQRCAAALFLRKAMVTDNRLIMKVAITHI